MLEDRPRFPGRREPARSGAEQTGGRRRPHEPKRSAGGLWSTGAIAATPPVRVPCCRAEPTRQCSAAVALADHPLLVLEQAQQCLPIGPRDVAAAEELAQILGEDMAVVGFIWAKLVVPGCTPLPYPGMMQVLVKADRPR